MDRLSTNSEAGDIRAEWRLLVACALGVGFGSIGFVTYSIGAFVEPLHHEFGWTRAQIQGAIAFGMGFGGFAAPAVGFLIDRYGGRVIALWGLVGVAAGYAFAAATNQHLLCFYAAYATIALLGAGSGPVSWTRAAAARFHQRRGLALALTLSGTGIAAMAVPPYAVFFVASFGWRWGYLALSALPLLALATAFFYFHPDRIAIDAADECRDQPFAGATLRQAVTSYRFWLLLASILAIYLGITGIVPNLIPALTDAGFTPSAAASIQSAYGLSLIVTRLAIGDLLDRFWAPGVAALALTAPAVGCFILTSHPTYLAALLASALVGAAAGAELDLLAFFAARYFGLRSYGRIYGCLYIGVACGAGLGPIAFAYLAQLTGSYVSSFQAARMLFCFGGLSMLLLGRYPRSDAATSPK